MDEARQASVEAAIAAQEAQRRDWTNQSIYDVIGGNYASLSQYLKVRRAQARHPGARTLQAVAEAVAAAPLPSPTEAYVACAEALAAEEQRLSALQNRQQSGQRLSRDEVLDRLMVQEGIEQLRREVELLDAPMRAEQLALDVADVCEVVTSWVPPLDEAFAGLVAALQVPYQEIQRFLAVHAGRDRALASMPAYQHVTQRLPPEQPLEPSGREQIRNMLVSLPHGAALAEWLLSPTSGGLTHGQVETMRSLHVSAKPIDARHLARRLTMQQRSR